MRTIMIVLSFLIGGLIVGFLIWYLPVKLFPQYTAQAFIRVVPATERGSIVALLKHQSTLESVVDRDKVQQTGWFQHRGTTKDEKMASAVADLKKRLGAGARPSSDLVAVSMTCDNGDEAAVIVNEMADIFLQRQLSAKRKQIASNLMYLEEQHTRLQRDLDLAERAMDDVRRRYGLTDLEQHDYPHPITARLIRLQSEEDDCVLEIKQLQIQLDELAGRPQVSSSGKAEPNSPADIKDVQFRLKLLQGKFEELKKMREEAGKKQEELDLARAQYTFRQAIRDNRRQALESIKSRIEELKILHDDPDSSGVQLVEYGAIPRQADMRPWQTIVPIAGAAGLLLGIICVLLAKRSERENPR